MATWQPTVMTSDSDQGLEDKLTVDQSQRSHEALTEATRSTKSTTTTPGAVQRHLLLTLIALRLVNALTISTFFQPDEFYQALEPAWALAFGGESGAWITWVC